MLSRCSQHRAPEPLRRGRLLDVADAERRERVDKRVGETDTAQFAMPARLGAAGLVHLRQASLDAHLDGDHLCPSDTHFPQRGAPTLFRGRGAEYRQDRAHAARFGCCHPDPSM
jgi:hypothetical protein